MKCPKCNSGDCQIINEFSTSGKAFHASKGCCGAVLLGPIGLLCGMCGKGKQAKNESFWLCNNCGKKWKA